MLGRFLSADTIVPNASDPQALNRYAYVRNNPLNLTDPTGHSWLSKAWRKSGAAKWWNKNRDIVRGLALQTFGGVVGTIAGSALLTQSEAGRNILAGQILVATAVASFYCGGCGVGVGALVGEALGAYSAHQAGGDILSGVAVGGSIGALTGGLRGIWVVHFLEIASSLTLAPVRSMVPLSEREEELSRGMVEGLAVWQTSDMALFVELQLYGAGAYYYKHPEKIKFDVKKKWKF